MPTLTLKSYQQGALDSLRSFVRSAQLKGPALAFGEQVRRPYNPDPFGEVPCTCLRIPTGGGKTQIKVATGDTRELDGLDLAARDCPVRSVPGWAWRDNWTHCFNEH